MSTSYRGKVPWLLLGVAALSAELLQHGSTDWNLLSHAGGQLLGRDGLHVYADTPALQAGPLSVLVFGLLAHLEPTVALVAVHVLMWAAGWWCLTRAAGCSAASDLRVPVPALCVGGLACAPVLLSALSEAPSPYPLRILLLASWLAGMVVVSTRRAADGPRSTVSTRVLVGLLLVPSWAALAALTAHLDDALAISVLVWAALQARRGERPLPVAVAVGIAIACKPWAVVGLAFLGWRGTRSVRDYAVSLGIAAGSWLPFVLADHRTLGAASRAFPIAMNSSVRVLGLHAAVAPSWLRSCQLLAILVVALLAAARRGPLEALAAGMAVRLLLDPASFGYYMATALLAVAVLDLGERQRPWRTALGAIGILVPPVLLPGELPAIVRTATLFVLLVSCIAPASSSLRAPWPRGWSTLGRSLPSWLTRTPATSR